MTFQLGYGTKWAERFNSRGAAEQAAGRLAEKSGEVVYVAACRFGVWRSLVSWFGSADERWSVQPDGRVVRGSGLG